MKVTFGNHARESELSILVTRACVPTWLAKVLKVRGELLGHEKSMLVSITVRMCA